MMEISTVGVNEQGDNNNALSACLPCGIESLLNRICLSMLCAHQNVATTSRKISYEGKPRNNFQGA